MTIFHIDGFETYGDKTTAGSDLETRLSATDDVDFVVVTGGHGGNVELIDDFETDGLALQFPPVDAGSGEYVRYGWPDGSGRYDDYRVTTNASHPTMVTGFRLFNADTDPAQQVTVWQCLAGASGGTGQARLAVASNSTDLVFIPASGASTTISSVLTVDTWHYIEVEFKFTTGVAGGFIKVYVDGTEVANLTSQNLATFTFNTGYGVRIGCEGASNETGGNQFAIDDVYHMEVDGVTHTAPLGPVRVVLMAPNGDTINTDWDPSTGSDNYSLVNGTDWDTSTYVDGDSTGDEDDYELATLSGSSTVHGLQIDVVCVATDGTPTLTVGFEDGSTDEESQGVIGTGSNVQKRQFFDTDPGGGTWTEADANAVVARQKMTE